MTTAVSLKNEVAMQPKFTTNLLDRWLKFAGVCEKSQTTYNTAIKQLFKYFAANNITQPTRENLYDWAESLKAAERSASTIQLYVTSFKLFFRWLGDEGLYPNIADHFKFKVKVNRKHKKGALSAQQGANLLKAVQGDSELAKRNRAIIALMLTAGLRTIEIERANVGDIFEFGGKYYLKVQCKGHSTNDEEVLLATQVYALIRDYLSCRDDVSEDSPLFVSTSRRCKGNRLSTQTIRKMTKSYLRDIGLGDKRYSAHALRHSAAMQMILAGVAILEVKKCLHHQNIQTTMIYLEEADRFKITAEQTVANSFFAGI